MLKISARLLVPAACLSALLTGCRSHFIGAKIENGSSQMLRIVELDYPGGSFGVSTLAPRGVYAYRFKAIGSGPLALSYTEASGAPHTANGPEIKDGQEGTFTVRIGDHGAVTWSPVASAR